VLGEVEAVTDLTGKRATVSPLPIAAIRKSAAPLRHEVLDALRRSIVHGHLAPGARLIERELIETMAVSRTVVREVLRQLESEGLVDVVPNKGAVVRKLSIEEARDLYAIRAVLEGLAARMFVEKADSHCMQRLGEELAAVVEAYRSAQPPKIIEIKNRFYEALFAGAQSESLSTMLGALHGRIWRWRALGLSHPKRSPGRSDESVAGLRALYAAIIARNADLAEQLARREVMHAADEVMRILRQDGDSQT
jgi:DNA-binding GntR family transcriptional regulator